MSGVNRIILLGYVGSVEDMRTTQGGMAVKNLSLATSEKIKGEEFTEWHKLVCFGKTAEIADEYVNKGSQIFIEGKVRTNTWEDKEGNKRETKQVIVDRLTLLGGKSRQDDVDL